MSKLRDAIRTRAAFDENLVVLASATSAPPALIERAKPGAIYAFGRVAGVREENERLAPLIALLIEVADCAANHEDICESGGSTLRRLRAAVEALEAAI